MIMSVSTLTIGSGAATPVSFVNLSMGPASLSSRIFPDPLYTSRRLKSKGLAGGGSGARRLEVVADGVIAVPERLAAVCLAGPGIELKAFAGRALGEDDVGHAVHRRPGDALVDPGRQCADQPDGDVAGVGVPVRDLEVV